MRRGVKEVPSKHDFFDPDYVKHWIEGVRRYRPERKRIFQAFATEIARAGKETPSLLELGCGPGYLAKEILQGCSVKHYCLFDFSPRMLELSRKQLACFRDKTVFVRGDFKKARWASSLPGRFDFVVALQSVHELRHASRIPRLYRQVYDLLSDGGVFLVCDHVNPPMAARHREAHFMTVAEHLATLRKVGFKNAKELSAASDLSLMRAQKA